MARHGRWWEYVIPGWNAYRIYQDISDPGGGKYGKQPDYSESNDRVYAAWDNVQRAEANHPGNYQSKYANQINGVQSKLNDMNQKGFSYDYTKDAAYQQYKNRYTRGAELASEDATAQAAARSGGYSNSWGTSSGQTAYQNTMNGLASVADSLYNQAYNEYNTKKSDLSSQLGALRQQESLALQEYQTNLSKYYDDLNYAANEYNSAVSAAQQRRANSTSKWGTVMTVAANALPYILGLFL